MEYLLQNMYTICVTQRDGGLLGKDRCFHVFWVLVNYRSQMSNFGKWSILNSILFTLLRLWPLRKPPVLRCAPNNSEIRPFYWLLNWEDIRLERYLNISVFTFLVVSGWSVNPETLSDFPNVVQFVRNTGMLSATFYCLSS